MNGEDDQNEICNLEIFRGSQHVPAVKPPIASALQPSKTMVHSLRRGQGGSQKCWRNGSHQLRQLLHIICSFAMFHLHDIKPNIKLKAVLCVSQIWEMVLQCFIASWVHMGNSGALAARCAQVTSESGSVQKALLRNQEIKTEAGVCADRGP